MSYPAYNEIQEIVARAPGVSVANDDGLWLFRSPEVDGIYIILRRDHPGLGRLTRQVIAVKPFNHQRCVTDIMLAAQELSAYETTNEHGEICP